MFKNINDQNTLKFFIDFFENVKFVVYKKYTNNNLYYKTLENIEPFEHDYYDYLRYCLDIGNIENVNFLIKHYIYKNINNY